MSMRAHLNLGRLGSLAVAVSLVAIVGCGGDDGEKTSPVTAGKGGSGGDGGKSGSSAPRGGSGGSTAMEGSPMAGPATGMGMLEEGSVCQSTAECAMGNACLQQRVGTIGVRVCARPCTAEADCEMGEVCASPYTQQDRDAHCTNIEANPFAFCGPGATAVCGNMRPCLLLPMSTLGVCVDLCAVQPGSDAGEATVEMCPPTQPDCVAEILEDPNTGVCADLLARDEVCVFEEGKICPLNTDICTPDNLEDVDSIRHCRENCTDSSTCESGGTCTTAPSGEFRYCKK